MSTTLEKSLPFEAQQETADASGQASPEVPKYDEAGLEKLVNGAHAQIETEQAVVLQKADARIEQAPVPIGLNQQKANSIFASGGFANRIGLLKQRVLQLGQEVNNKIASLANKTEQGLKNSKVEQVPKLEELPKETALLSKMIESSKQLTHRAQLITLEGGTRAIFKSEFDESKRMPQRERAAYLVDRVLKFNLVPPTVIREVNGKVGSFQEYIEDGKEITIQNSETLKDSEFVKMFVFDYLIGIRDRNYESGQNFLITPRGPKAIDNELTFDTSTANLNFLGKELPASITNEIIKITEGDLKILENELLALLPQAEALKCIQRIKSLAISLKKFGSAIPESEAGFLRRGY